MMLASRRTQFVHWMIIGLVIAIIYLPATRLYFYADDFTMLGWFRNETSWVHSLTKDLELGYGFRPILDFRLWATFHWFGWNPTPYYILSILQHWVASILVYVLAGRLFPQKPIALWAGLIFGIAFSHQEVITWISASHVSLMTCFYVGTILIYLRWRDRRGLGWYIASLACFLAATLTSQDAISLILILAITELFFYRHDRSNLRKTILYLMPYGILVLPYGLTQAWMIYQGTSEAVSQGGNSYTVGLHILPALTNLGYLVFANPYLVNFFPRLVEIVRNSPLISSILNLYKFIMQAGWIITIIILWIKGDRMIRYLLLFTIVAFLPYTLWSIPSLWAASRYLYLPSIAFSILLGYGIARLGEKITLRIKRPLWLASGAVVLVYMIVNVVPMQALLAQLQRSGETRRDIIKQMTSLQPSFPENARVYLTVPHGIYGDLQYGLPEFYSAPIKVFPIPPGQLPDQFSPNDYYYTYHDGMLEQVNIVAPTS